MVMSGFVSSFQRISLRVFLVLVLYFLFFFLKILASMECSEEHNALCNSIP